MRTRVVASCVTDARRRPGCLSSVLGTFWRHALSLDLVCAARFHRAGRARTELRSSPARNAAQPGRRVPHGSCEAAHPAQRPIPSVKYAASRAHRHPRRNLHPICFRFGRKLPPKPAFPAELILFISGSYDGLNRRNVLDVDQPAVRFFRQGTRTNLVSWFRIVVIQRAAAMSNAHFCFWALRPHVRCSSATLLTSGRHIDSNPNGSRQHAMAHWSS
jgi:hypothetical protein